MKKLLKLNIIILAIIAGFTTSCNREKPATTLKDAFKGMFYIGTAVNRFHFNNLDTTATRIVTTEFNSVTPENTMKWDSIHPSLNEYNFRPADDFVAFGEKNNMFIVGHCMVWHAQIGDWVFQDSTGAPLTRDALLARLKDHITTIMTRYKGRVKGYDIVNEALNEDGSYRQSKWYQIIGEDYIEKAFQFAYEADSTAELYYNDYNIETPAKREGALRIIKNLKEKGIRIDEVGIQGHYHLDVPSLKDIEESIIEFGKLGVKVAFTEVDINVLPRPENHTGANINDHFELTEANNPYPNALPDSMQQTLANRYADFFKIFIKHKDIVDRITFWGINDKHSWLNGWPIPGRTNYPLLFDRDNKPKPAYYSILATAKEE